MKKFLLFAAAVAMAAPSWAEVINDDTFDPDQDRTPGPLNLVENGSFDNPDYVTAIFGSEEEGFRENPYGWIEDVVNCVSEGDGTVPGWEINTAGMWNGIVQIYSHDEPDDWWIEASNKYCLRSRHYTDNGWTSITLEGTAKGLEIGKTYTLDLMVWHHFPEDATAGDPKVGFKIVDEEGSGEGYPSAEAGRDDSSMGDGSNWSMVKTTFQAKHETVKIQLYSGVWNYEGNTVPLHWVQWDEVRIYDPATTDGISNLAVDEAAAQEIYTLQGVRVPANSALKGVYIVKQGNKVSKIAY